MGKSGLSADRAYEVYSMAMLTGASHQAVCEAVRDAKAIAAKASAYTQGYLDAIHDSRMADLYRTHLEFGYEIDGRVYTCAELREASAKGESLYHRCSTENGMHYWKRDGVIQRDKPFSLPWKEKVNAA